MDGSIAQIAALTCYVNARLRGLAVPRFFPDNSTCQFCEWIQFIRTSRSGNNQWEVIARSPDEWMDAISTGAYSRATLINAPVNDPKFTDRMSAGFVGGGRRWLLCVQRDGRSECWQAGWQVGNRDAPDQRVWRVQYALVEERPTARPVAITLAEIAIQLVDALTEIEAFARRNGLDSFADCFAKALLCLTADDPFSVVYHRDLAPHGSLPKSAVRVLAACQAAWVFGAMGSWNDLGFQGNDQNLYDRLSDRLYGLLNDAICVGANTSSKSVPHA
jgi:hypothetical protein